MIRIRLASAPGRCYISIAVCTPAGEAAPRRISGAAAPKEQPPRKLSGKRTAGARALWKAAVGQARPSTEGVSRDPDRRRPRGAGGDREILRGKGKGGHPPGPSGSPKRGPPFSQSPQ